MCRGQSSIGRQLLKAHTGLGQCLRVSGSHLLARQTKLTCGLSRRNAELTKLASTLLCHLLRRQAKLRALKRGLLLLGCQSLCVLGGKLICLHTHLTNELLCRKTRLGLLLQELTGQLFRGHAQLCGLTC